MPLMSATPAAQLEARLAGFAARLRKAGLPLGTAELLDALRALQYVDVSQKSMVKTALKATLAKNKNHQALFERIFEDYFIPPEEHSLRAREEARRRHKLELRYEEAARSLQFKGETLRLSTEEMLLYTSLPEEQRRGLLNFVRQTNEGKNVGPQFRPLLETVVKGHLSYWRSRMERSEPGAGGSGAANFGGAGSGSGENRLRQMDIRLIRNDELPAAEALIYKLSQKLVRRLTRRRKASRRGPLDLRRSIRNNLHYGGSIFWLRHRRKRPPRQQLLLICDVSASMQRYSVFVLQFIYGLQAAVQNLESFSFSDNLEYLSPALQRQKGLESLLARVVNESGNWGGGTNLSAALQQLLGSYRHLLNRRTCVIIVSDTKTLALEPSLQALLRLKLLVKKILWLNPLPPQQWRLYRSVDKVRQLTEMWPCHTIADLEAVVAGRIMADANNCYPNIDQEGGAIL